MQSVDLDDESVINQIPISKFRTNSIQMIEGKLLKKDNEESDQNNQDVNMNQNIEFSETIRLPNIAK